MIWAFRFKLSMPPVPCNKCRSGRQTESDSWCLGCSSLEVTLQLFRKRWSQPGIRAIAEEAALSCARFVRGLHNLDSTLCAPSAGEGIHLAPKSRPLRPRSRTPLRDERPPLLRSGPSREPPERKRDRDQPERGEERKASEESYSEGSEEEEDAPHDPEVKQEEKEAARDSGHSRRREKEAEEKAHRSRRERGSEKPPEPPHPPPGHEGRSRRSGKKRKRGGTKHQRHYRERENPLKSSHRRLGSSQLSLARTLDEGLERRA